MHPTSTKTLTFPNPFALEENVNVNINNPTKSETQNIQETKPRTVSKNKSKSEANSTNEGRTALLEKQETHQAQVKIFDQGDKTTKNNEPINKQYKETTHKAGISGLPSMTDYSHQKQSANSLDIGGAKDSFSKGEKECLSKECQQEHKSLIKGKNLKATNNQIHNSIQHEQINSVDDFSVNENEEECIQEDKPLILDGTRPSTQQGLMLPLKENMKSPGKNPDTADVCVKADKTQVKKAGNELLGVAPLGSTTLPTTVETKTISTKKRHENQADNEADKLLSANEGESEESRVQRVLPETNTAASVHETESNEGEVIGSRGESSEKVKNESSADQVETPVVSEADEDSPTAEENTPLV